MYTMFFLLILSMEFKFIIRAQKKKRQKASLRAFRAKFPSTAPDSERDDENSQENCVSILDMLSDDEENNAEIPDGHEENV